MDERLQLEKDLAVAISKNRRTWTRQEIEYRLYNAKGLDTALMGIKQFAVQWRKMALAIPGRIQSTRYVAELFTGSGTKEKNFIVLKHDGRETLIICVLDRYIHRISDRDPKAIHIIRSILPALSQIKNELT